MSMGWTGVAWGWLVGELGRKLGATGWSQEDIIFFQFFCPAKGGWDPLIPRAFWVHRIQKATPFTDKTSDAPSAGRQRRIRTPQGANSSTCANGSDAPKTSAQTPIPVDILAKLTGK
jgi:hypothetical protein